MSEHWDYDLLVIGGGAAGIFGALSFRELCPQGRVAVFEKGNRLLTKVKISGGGRCNVTHACFDPKTLTQHYPRGSRELRGAFHRWQPRDMQAWFQERGVWLKTEADGRMFPASDDSRTIIDCFLDEARQGNIELFTRCGVKALEAEAGGFTVRLADESSRRARSVLIATGGGGQVLAESLGHKLVPCVPSLFTFNIKDTRLEGLSGLSVPVAQVKTDQGKRIFEGPLLITHWGLSGPAVLRCSAWLARELHACDYRFSLEVNWTGGQGDAEAVLTQLRKAHPRKRVVNTPALGLPARLWERLVLASGVEEEVVWSQLPREPLRALLRELSCGVYAVEGKSTYKDEFVTCGGVALEEIDTRRFASRKHEGLYFAGEVLDIDGITGGFNFQAAWTGARLAAMECAERVREG